MNHLPCLPYLQGLRIWDIFSLDFSCAPYMPGVEKNGRAYGQQPGIPSIHDIRSRGPHLVDRRGNRSDDVYVANGISKTSVGSLHICLDTLCNNLSLVIEKTGKKVNK